VTIKPFRRSLGWTVGALRAAPQNEARPVLVVDLDDYDAAIHAEWHRELPPLERARSVARSELSPIRIRVRIRQLLPAATMLTVSSWALRRCLPRFSGPEVRLPHPRSARAYEPPVPSERLRIGFLGTPVGYKGVETICRIIATRGDTELHVLAGTEDTFSPVGRERLVVHAHHGPETLMNAFRHIDVVVLPQDAAVPAARYQLPAKLVDALRFGRPVVATDTPPIRELAGPSVTLVSSWDRLDDGLKALDALRNRERRETLGRQGSQAWAAGFSTSKLAGELGAALANAGVTRREHQAPDDLGRRS
jgi:glycosyltransferase involved in cell wall biosynthesis